ncbi:hypothetical protein [Kineococcus sp. SYSU DK006]|uniref:hypothetical protein n=1 Tax=Kineococcus sp. SYSU DK006 TaxID=3383127 RepID=UPI003D7D9BD9
MVRPLSAVRRALVAAPLAGLALAALAAAPAGADPAPAVPADVVAQVAAAVTASPATAGVPATDYAVTDVRTAAGDPGWAAAALTPTATGAATLDPATAVLQHVDGGWQVVELGTAQVGCDLVPAQLRADLALTC